MNIYVNEVVKRMSSPLAIAAVTTTLRDLLYCNIKVHYPGVIVTTKPLDKAFNGVEGNRINLFLYQANMNAALRNMDLPFQVKSGETATPALALDLYYLLSVYGENEDETDPVSHKLLGYAMSILHDNTMLRRIIDCEDKPLDNEIIKQIERVRITHQPLTMDDQSKLWTSCQTQYRLSTAYLAAVVLIDSNNTNKIPLPVLRRGAEDRGVNIKIGSFPIIEEFVLPKPFTRARLGDDLELRGTNLAGLSVNVKFTHPALTEPVVLIPLDGSTETKLLLRIPDDIAAENEWAAGVYSVVVVIKKNSNETDRVSNALPLSLAPRLTDINPNPATRDGDKKVTLQITCKPKVLPVQQARLLIGERDIPAEVPPIQTETLSFIINDAVAGEFLVRLRIDGIDTLPVNQTPSGLEFDSNQKVAIND